jgi:hypothetical protein
MLPLLTKSKIFGTGILYEIYHGYKQKLESIKK